MWFDFPSAVGMNRLQSEMERVLGNGADSVFARAPAYPAVNLWDDDDNLYVESEVPGMELDEFEIFVNDDNQLTLQGERKQPNESVETRHRVERMHGRFSRVIELPVSVESDATAATYQAGVLQIRLPKKAESKPRRIKVAAG